MSCGSILLELEKVSMIYFQLHFTGYFMLVVNRVVMDNPKRIVGEVCGFY